MGHLSDDAKEKIQSLSQRDVPLKERRSWYNAMGRRFEKPAGLKPGLLEKYQQCQGNSNLRWEMLKAFMCDKDMNLDCVCFSLCFVPCHILRCKMHEFYNNFMCDFNWLEFEERS